MFCWKNFIYMTIFTSWSKFLLPRWSGSYLRTSTVLWSSFAVANSWETFSRKTAPLIRSTPKSIWMDLSWSFSFLRWLSCARKDFLIVAIPILYASVIFCSICFDSAFSFLSIFKFKFFSIYCLLWMSCSTTSVVSDTFFASFYCWPVISFRRKVILFFNSL